MSLDVFSNPSCASKGLLEVVLEWGGGRQDVLLLAPLHLK